VHFSFGCTVSCRLPSITPQPKVEGATPDDVKRMIDIIDRKLDKNVPLPTADPRKTLYNIQGATEEQAGQMVSYIDRQQQAHLPQLKVEGVRQALMGLSQPRDVKVQGEVTGESKIVVEVVAGSDLIATKRSLDEALMTLRGFFRLNAERSSSPGSLGTSSPDAAAPHTNGDAG